MATVPTNEKADVPEPLARPDQPDLPEPGKPVLGPEIDPPDQRKNHPIEPPIEETATEARQAVKVPPMKYVLGFGIAGAVIGLLLAWLFL
ncbi:MAG: hypothetical protein AB7I34_25375 [Rhizobiaceae bacterium]